MNYTILYPIYKSGRVGVYQNENCIYDGKYCAADPDGAGIGTGAMVAEETLR